MKKRKIRYSKLISERFQMNTAREDRTEIKLNEDCGQAKLK